MRNRSFTLRRLLPVVQISFFLLSADLLWGQRPPPQAEIPVFHRVVQLSPVSEVERQLCDSPGSLLASSEVLRPPTEPQLRYSVFRNVNYPTLVEKEVAGKPPLPVTLDMRFTPKNRVQPLNKILTFESDLGHKQDSTIPSFQELEEFTRHIPLAGYIVLGISRQEKAHPRVARVLRLLKPRF